MTGNVWQDPEVERYGKNAVSVEEFKDDHFPSFCAGLTYFLTMSAIRSIVNTSMMHKTDFLWLDDVYITGILAKKAQTSLINLEVEQSLLTTFLFYNYRTAPQENVTESKKTSDEKVQKNYIHILNLM